MLNFKTPELSDRSRVIECFAQAHSMNCEYSFGSVYLWRTAYATKIVFYKDFFICRWGKTDISYSLPIGKGDFKDAVEMIIGDAGELGIKPKLYGVTESYRELLEKYFPGKFSYIYDDGCNDYIYNVIDLAELKGKKYHGKRNHIANFERNNTDWSYEELSESNIPECIDCHSEWIKSRDDDDPDYSLEFEAVLTGFENYGKLGFKGGAIRVHGKIIAYTYGEKINDTCFVSHFEKAPSGEHGAYAIINREFAKRLLLDGYEYVNREEDLGLEGLRKAKQSYHPAIWLKKETAVYEG